MTLLKKPINQNKTMRPIHLIENVSELGAGTRGASLGVAAMRMAALNTGSKLFSQLPVTALPHQNFLLFDPEFEQKTPGALRIEGIIHIYQILEEAIGRVCKAGEFPLILSGDHSSAGGTIAAIRKAHPDQRLGVIWIDAHADLHTPYTSPSGNVHGMPLAAALGLDDEARKHLSIPDNRLSPEGLAGWERLKQFGGQGPNIQFEDLVFIAVRDIEVEEQDLIEHHQIPNFTVEAVRSQGTQTVAQRCLEHLSDCDLIYISFDVDSMDSNIISHGTGTPVPNGLFEYEALSIIRHLLTDERICCLEFTEVNPLLDEKGNAMAEAAFRILEQVVKSMKKASNPSIPLIF